MSKTLHLPLKREWYEMIESGVKTEECEEALQALTNGELEVSSKTHKHTRLEIERIVKHSNFEKTGKN